MKKKIYKITFVVGIPETAECWEDGYLNNGNIGQVNYMVLGKHGRQMQCLGYESLTGAQSSEPGDVLHVRDFAVCHADKFGLSLGEFEEILELSILNGKTSNCLGKGRLHLNIGDDFGGEIPLTGIHLSSSEKSIARAVFTSVESGELDSGNYLDSEEIAALFIPHNPVSSGVAARATR